MKIGVLGTGMVGRTVGAGLIKLGHEVTMGSRSKDNSDALDWAATNGDLARNGTFADAAQFGDMVFNCTAGQASLVVLESAGADNLADKVLVDVSNPLSFSDQGVALTICNDDSLGERIQAQLPGTKVVKALNTITADLMLAPGELNAPGIIPICGNDQTAKDQVTQLLGSAGWPTDSIIDLGDITNARGTEAFLLYWVRLYQARGTAKFNLALVE